MTKINSECARAILRIAAGGTVEAIESAKRVIQFRDPSASALLMDIVASTHYPLSSRTAAAYALGFQGDRSASRILSTILSDESAASRLRAHAAEALGNIRDRRALPILRKVLMSDRHIDVKKSCIYALSQLKTPGATATLRRFKSTSPSPILKRETEAALKRLTRS